jgi:tetratricopeptide (TPR) repeat protein
VLFFLVLLGSGVALTVRDRTARLAKVAGKVEGIFAEVDRLEHEQKWSEALAAARQAAAAATGGEADAAMAERVGELLKDLEFINRLEILRLKKATFAGGDFDRAGADRDYAQAFRDYGVDIDELPAETSIDRLKTRPALAFPVAAALDEWVFVRFAVSEKDAARWQRLVAVARGVDPEPLRDRLRVSWGQPVSEAQDDLRRLAGTIKIGAHHPATLRNLALSLERLGQPDAALRLLRAARHFYPGDFWLNFELALTLSRRKDYDGAVRFNTAAVAILPNSAAAHNNLGLALAEQKKLDEAIACYRKAIELEPKDALAYSNLAIALHAQKKLGEAVAEYEKALRLKPDHHVTLFYLGRALGEQGKWDLALPHFQQAAANMEKRRFKHEHATIIVNELIRCHERLRQFDHADVWRRKLLTREK